MINKFISIIFIFILSFSLIYGDDSNGVWHYAKDIRSGDFGSDEQGTGGYFRFINPLTFNSTVQSNSWIDFTGDIGVRFSEHGSGFYMTNSMWVRILNDKGLLTSGEIRGGVVSSRRFYDLDDTTFVVDPTATSKLNNLRLLGVVSCNKLVTGIDGSISCGTDNVTDADSDPNNEMQTLSISGHTLSISGKNSVTLPDNVDDADHVIGNEYPVAGVGISVSGRTVGINTAAISSCTGINQKIIWDSSNNRLKCAIDQQGVTSESDPVWSSEKSNYATKSYVDSNSGGSGDLYTLDYYLGSIESGSSSTPTTFSIPTSIVPSDAKTILLTFTFTAGTSTDSGGWTFAKTSNSNSDWARVLKIKRYNSNSYTSDTNTFEFPYGSTLYAYRNVGQNVPTYISGYTK